MNVVYIETYTCNETSADYIDIAVGTNDNLSVTITGVMVRSLRLAVISLFAHLTKPLTC